MKSLNNNVKMLLVSSYPPGECGIASFCYDMAVAVRRIFGQSLPVKICALQNNAHPMPYGGRYLN